MTLTQSEKQTQVPKGPRIVVVGAGVGGIMFAIALRRHLPQFQNLTIYEKGPDVGGTWRDNTYPGCASDIHTHFYSFSSELNPEWNQTHEFQPEFQKYWQSLAVKYNIYAYLQVNTLVTSAIWDDSAKLYHVTTKDLLTGNENTSTAEILISALGILEVTRTPDIPGVSSFAGQSFHSGTWDQSVDLHNKRVAVIGNGASASQFVPLISDDPSVQVVQFCRTPNWIFPPVRGSYGAISKWAFRHVPFCMRLHRISLFFLFDFLYLTVFGNGVFRRWLTKFLKYHIARNAPKEYVDEMIPNYTLGCKRVLFDSNYLSSLHKPNLKLNWDGIQSIDVDGIITQKGEKIPFDVIIYATGFVTDEYPLHVRGINRTVKEYYDAEGGPKAYMGTTVPEFPNFYMLAGPNTITGHTSVIYTEEIQIGYILNFIKPVIDGAVRTFEVSHAATDAYNDKIHKRLKHSVFVDCVSWYRKGRDGKVSSAFPGAGMLFWWWFRNVHWDHYKVDSAAQSSWAQHLRQTKARKFLLRSVLIAPVVAGLYLSARNYGF